ncbi:MAG: transporter [Syntrophotaleaceae bacterium]
MVFQLTAPTLILIMSMWIPVAFLYLGHGDAKGTGAVTAFVGFCVIVSSFLHALFGAGAVGALLFAHGLLYCTVAYALLAGLEDLKAVGNVSLVAMIISFLFIFFFKNAGANYFALCSVGYTVLTLEVFLVCYGKFSAKLLAYSLIIWAFVGLMIPAFADPAFSGLLWQMPF